MGDIAVGIASLKEQMKSPMFVTKGGVGYGTDEMSKVADDGKGWVWIAAEMSPGGLAIELFKSTPYGKRALFCAESNNVDEMFAKIIWDLMDKRIDTTGRPAGEAEVSFHRSLVSVLLMHLVAMGTHRDSRLCHWCDKQFS